MLFVAYGRFGTHSLFSITSQTFMSTPYQQAATSAGVNNSQQAVGLPPKSGFDGNPNSKAPYPCNAPAECAVPQQQPFPMNPAGSTIPVATPIATSPNTSKEGETENKNGFMTTLKQVGNGAVKVYGSIYVCNFLF